jgi:hypothetical protein
MKPWTDPCSHIPARVEIPHSWRLVRYILLIRRKRLRGRVVIVLKQIFANQYLCLAVNKSLVIKSCSGSVNHSAIFTRCYGHSNCSRLYLVLKNETEIRLEYIYISKFWPFAIKYCTSSGEKPAYWKFNTFSYKNRKCIGKSGRRHSQVGAKQNDTCVRKKSLATKQCAPSPEWQWENNFVLLKLKRN